MKNVHKSIPGGRSNFEHLSVEYSCIHEIPTVKSSVHVGSKFDKNLYFYGLTNELDNL